MSKRSANFPRAVLNARPVVFLVFLLCAVNVFAQTGEWETLRTDGGEFSMKMPAGCHTYFYDPNGISVRDKNGDIYRLKKMRLISCFRDQTLLDVEIYESNEPRRAVKALFSQNEKSGRNISSKNGENTFARRFEAGENHVYIITTATRGESIAVNPLTKTFFESLKFASGDKPFVAGSEKFVSISSLKSFTPELIYETDQPMNPQIPTVPAKDDPRLKKAIMLSLPTASYTEAARKNKVRGNIKLRLTLGADGRVSQFRVIKSLPDGLLREAVIMAMRTKFLPEEYDGKPRSSSQLIEYKFDVF